MCRIAFIPARQNDEPLDGIDSQPVFDEVLQQQSEAAHRQQQEAPVNQPRKVVEVWAPWEERVARFVNAERRNKKVYKSLQDWNVRWRSSRLRSIIKNVT